MSAMRVAAAILLSCVVIVSCGGNGPTEPSSTGETDFPTTVSVPGSTCQSGPGGPSSAVSAIFFVTGFSSKVADPGAAAPLEARVKVGDRVKVSLQFQGCGYGIEEAWSSQDTGVGTVTQDPAFPGEAEFLAVAAGTTTVFVDFTAMDKKRHRTTLGYCSLDALYPGFPGLGVCGNPKLIGTVRVVE